MMKNHERRRGAVVKKPDTEIRGALILGFMVMVALLVLIPGEVRAEEIRLPGVGYSAYDPSTVVQPSSRAYAGGFGENAYRIGASDVLSISVWQNPSLNTTATVRFDGRISMPLAGEIVAAGLTPTEVAAEISERLREFIRNPQVTVTVDEFHSRQVVVLGAVSRPGIYPLQGPMKLLELLTVSGVNLQEINLGSIRVIRSNGQTLIVDLGKFLFQGDPTQNVELRAGDNVFVPARADEPVSGDGTVTIEPKEIMVLGAVNNPGAYAFDPGREVNVNTLLLKAGGVKNGAALKDAKIVRADRIQEPTNIARLIFDGDMSQNHILHSGDVLYVPQDEEIRIYVLGMVAKPGIFQGQPEKLDLMQALSLAIPDKFGAVLSNVKVVRGWPHNPKVISANVDALLNQGVLAENIPLLDGDVVYVPESFLSNVLDVLARVLAPLSTGVSFIDQTQDLNSERDR